MFNPEVLLYFVVILIMVAAMIYFSKTAPSPNASSLKLKPPRLIAWQVATLLLLLLIYLLAPQQLPVSFYKLSLVTMGGVIGYWLDRALFPYARPDAFFIEKMHQIHRKDMDDLVVSGFQSDTHGYAFCACMIRRAIIIASVMIAMGLGA